MATGSISGVGTIFQRWDGTQWVSIAEINAIVGPNAKRDNIDTTSFDTEEGYREFITGFRDGDEVSLNMSFTRDTFELMVNDFLDDEYQYYQILLTDVDETVIAFEGFVNKLPVELTADDRIKANISIKVTGQLEESANPIEESSYDVSSEVPEESESLEYFTLPVADGTLEGTSEEIYVMAQSIIDASNADEEVGTVERDILPITIDLSATASYVSTAWSDLFLEDPTYIMPLLAKYGFTASFRHPIYPKTDDFDNVGFRPLEYYTKIEQYGSYNSPTHAIFNHIAYFSNSPLYDGRTTPSNDDLRLDRGDGNNELGHDITTTVDDSGIPRSSWMGLSNALGATAWQDLTDADCDAFRKSMSAFGRSRGDTSLKILEAMDYLSNKYCGTSGASVLDGDYVDRYPNVLDSSSEPSEDNKIQGGIFQGASTTCNHEIWERLFVIQQNYEQNIGALTRQIIFSTTGGGGSKSLLYNTNPVQTFGRYHDKAHTKLACGATPFTSSITGETRSFIDVQRNDGRIISGHSYGEGYAYYSFDKLSRLEGQRFIKKNGFKKLDYVGDGYTNMLREFNAVIPLVVQNDALSSVDVVKYLYDYCCEDSSYAATTENTSPASLYLLINAITKYNAWGIIPDIGDDSGCSHIKDLQSSLMLFLETFYQFCKRAGITIISREESAECAQMSYLVGYNYFPNNMFATTPKTVIGSLNAPDYPDGWNGGEVLSEDTGSGMTSVLHIDIAGTIFTRQYAIKPDTFTLSFRAKGVGILKIRKILNKNIYNTTSGSSFTEINSITINSPSEYTLYSDTVTIPDEPLEIYDSPVTPEEVAYQNYMSGYGDKICGIQIELVITSGNYVKIGNCSLLET